MMHCQLIQEKDYLVAISQECGRDCNGDNIQIQFRFESPNAEQKASCPIVNVLALQAEHEFIEQRFVAKARTYGKMYLTSDLLLRHHHHHLCLCYVPQWRLLLLHPSQTQASSSHQNYQFGRQSEEFHLCFPKQSRKCRIVLLKLQNRTRLESRYFLFM